jgi:hypothetical protein
LPKRYGLRAALLFALLLAIGVVSRGPAVPAQPASATPTRAATPTPMPPTPVPATPTPRPAPPTPVPPTPTRTQPTATSALAPATPRLRVSCGEHTRTVGPGDFVMMPRGIPYACSTLGDGSARLLQITAPAGFERFIAEAGEPAAEPIVPPPAEPDVAKLLRVTAKYHKRMVGMPASEDERR